MKSNVIVGVVGLMIGVFLGFFSGGWLEGREAAQRRAVAFDTAAEHSELQAKEMLELRQHADLLQIKIRLGRVALEADQQDYGLAATGATLLFDDILQMAEEVRSDDEEVYALLQRVLEARDDVTAGLATADPEAAEKLKQLALELFYATP